jgi:hypothetical protein
MPYPVSAARGRISHPTIPPVEGTGDFNAATWVVANAKAFWRFQGDGADKTGRGNTLTEVNAPTYAAGKVGNAVSLEAASSQYLSRASTSDLQIGAGDFIIATWVKPNAVEVDILGKGSEYSLTNSSNLVLTYICDPGNASVGVAALPVGEWSLVITRLNQANHSIYLVVNNATPTPSTYDPEVEGNPVTGSGDLKVGVTDLIGSYFDGLIDDTFIFKAATPLSSEDFNILCGYLWNGGSGQDLSVLF